MHHFGARLNCRISINERISKKLVYLHAAFKVLLLFRNPEYPSTEFSSSHHSPLEKASSAFARRFDRTEDLPAVSSAAKSCGLSALIGLQPMRIGSSRLND
jgi:hypothetical protein